MRALRIVQVASLILIDLVAFYTAIVLAILFRIYLMPGIITYAVPWVEDAFYNEELYWAHLEIWWIPLTLVLSIAYAALYQRRIPFWEEMWLLLKSVSVAILVVLAFVSLEKLGAQVSRSVLVSLWIILLIIFPPIRFLGKKLLYYLGIWRENVLVLGAGDAGIATLRGLERESTLGYRVIGFLDDDVQKIGTTIRTPKGEYQVFGSFKHFSKFIHLMKISTMIIAMPSLDPQKQAKIVGEVQRHVARVLVVPELKGIALLNTELRVLFMEQLFLLNIRNNLKSLHARIIKRCFDFIVSTMTIIIFAVPLLLIFLAVRLTSRGKAFFIQHRPGKNGRIIRIYKFRTMYVDGDLRLQKALTEDERLAHEWKVYRKLKTYDPRVTPVGKFLRKWSLDELPQIFNVW